MASGGSAIVARGLNLSPGQARPILDESRHTTTRQMVPLYVGEATPRPRRVDNQSIAPEPPGGATSAVASGVAAGSLCRTASRVPLHRGRHPRSATSSLSHPSASMTASFPPGSADQRPRSHLTSSLYSSRFASIVTLQGPSQYSSFHSPRQGRTTPPLHLMPLLNSPGLDSRFSSHGPWNDASIPPPSRHRPYRPRPSNHPRGQSPRSRRRESLKLPGQRALSSRHL